MLYIRSIVLISCFLSSYLIIGATIPVQAGGPGSRGTPNNRVGGGTRGENCTIDKTTSHQKLVALIPEQGTVQGTVAAPELLFYVPYSATDPNKPLTARFSLQDLKGYDVIAPIPLQLTGKPGIVSIQLKQTLEPGKVYQIHFAVICGTGDVPKRDVVSGWIQRIPATANAKIPTMSLPAKDANNNLWLDTLATISQAQCRQTAPTDFRDWSDVLKQLNLSSLSSEKVVQCFKQP